MESVPYQMQGTQFQVALTHPEQCQDLRKPTFEEGTHIMPGLGMPHSCPSQSHTSSLPNWKIMLPFADACHDDVVDQRPGSYHLQGELHADKLQKRLMQCIGYTHHDKAQGSVNQMDL
jgi:hypothetical protein